MQRMWSGTRRRRARGAIAAVALGGVVLICLGVSGCGDQDALDEGFRDCLSERGNSYRAAVSRFTREVEAETRLRAVHERFGWGRDEGLVAGILLARLAHPEVFVEYRQLLDGTSGSGKALLGPVRVFVSAGPESRTVSVPGELTQTERGWRPIFKDVEKYTEAEVAAGRARNHAARLAVLEHFMKFLDESGQTEQLEIIRLAEELWIHSIGVAGGKSGGISPGPFMDLMSDQARPWAIRVAAATAISRDRWVDVRETVFAALASSGTDSRQDSYKWFYDCGLALSRYGGQEDEARLRALEFEAPWKRDLVSTVLGEMEARRSK